MSKDLIKQTAIWYKKLKDSGFEDIEWTSKHSIYGQNTPYLKDSALNYKKKYNEFTATHFRICQNYLTHTTKLSKSHRFIFQMYTDGSTFREIISATYKKGWNKPVPSTRKHGKRKTMPRWSLFSLHHLIHKLVIEAYDWNKKDVEGLLNESPDLTFQSAPYLESNED